MPFVETAAHHTVKKISLGYYGGETVPTVATKVPPLPLYLPHGFCRFQINLHMK